MFETIDLNAPTDTTRTRVALEACRAEIEAVPESELIHINVDIPSTTATILAAEPKIRLLKKDLETLPSFDPLLLEKVEPRALALFEAHSDYLDAARPEQPIAELVAAATEARARLHAQAVALADRGLFPKESLAEYRGMTGHKILAVDVNLLCRGYRRKWADIEGKSPVTLAEIDRSEMLVEKLLTAVGEREQAPAVLAAATLFRQKAFTLAVTTYGELRRSVLYLRYREGDANQIAPSLYGSRNGGRRRDEADDAESAPTPASSTSAGGTLGAQANAPSASPFGATSRASAETLGLPDESPFIDG